MDQHDIQKHPAEKKEESTTGSGRSLPFRKEVAVYIMWRNSRLQTEISHKRRVHAVIRGLTEVTDTAKIAEELTRMDIHVRSSPDALQAQQSSATIALGKNQE